MLLNGRRVADVRARRTARRRPQLDPVRGDRARRSAEGRRLRHLRHRRHRRRDQLHPAQGLQGRRGARLLRRRPQQRRRRRSGASRVTGGWGDLTKDKFNVFVTVDYQKQDALTAIDRDISKTVVHPGRTALDRTSGNSFPANITIARASAGTRNPTYPNCAPSIVPDDRLRPRAVPLRLRASIEHRSRETEKSTSSAAARASSTRTTRRSSRARTQEREHATSSQPTPVDRRRSRRHPALILRRRAPFYPTAFIATRPASTGQPLDFRWRRDELGPARPATTDSDAYRAVGRPAGHRLQGLGLRRRRSTGPRTRRPSNSPAATSTQSQLLAAARHGRRQPVRRQHRGRRGSRCSATQVQRRRPQRRRRRSYGVDGKVSSEICKLPAGPLAMALGAECAQGKLDTINSDAARRATSSAAAARSRRSSGRPRRRGRSSPS